MTRVIVVMFAGYTIGSYGWILIKGYDVPWRRWVNPLDPWTWPKGADIPKVPAGHLLPG
jgi:hypothetical protein